MLSFLLLPVSLALHLSISNTVEDDAFIHWRVAGNFLEHGIAAFHLEDPIPSSSSPIWIVFLLLVRSIYPAASLQTVLILNALITVASTMACFRLYHTHLMSPSPRWISALLVTTVLSALLPASLSGMETPLGILLFVCGAIRFSSAPGWGVVFFVLAVASRLELAFPAMGWMAAHPVVLRNPRLSDLFLAFFSSLVVAAIIVTLFGTLRPSPAMAKSIVYDVELGDGVKLALFSTYGEFITKSIFPSVVLAIVAWALLCTWRGGFVFTRSTAQSWRIGGTLVVSGFAVAAGYVCAGVPVFPWYSPLALLPIILGLFLISNTNTMVRFPAIALAVPSLVVLAAIFAAACGYRDWYPLGASALRVSRYQQIGEVLTNDCSNAVLIAPEIGGLGHTFRNSFVDAIGLASSNVLQYHPLKVPSERGAGFIGGVPAALVAARNPDVIVGLPTMLVSFSRSAESARYDRVSCPTGVEGGIWGNASFDIYLRKDGACHSRRFCDPISSQNRL
jgi:hypothetical protein